MIDRNIEAPMTQKPCYGQFYRRTLMSLCGGMWLIANNLHDLKDKIIKRKSELPNVNGFEFVAIYKDGRLLKSVVKKNQSGLHFIDNYEDVVGWVSLNCP